MRYAHAPKQRTLTEIRNEMLMLLCNATPEAFARLTLDDLCRKYSRLRRGVVEADYRDAVASRRVRVGRVG